MKVIGAGLPRTATTTQLIALEMLGFPCYHMRDMMSDLATSVPQWRKALDGDGEWDELFDGKESIVDWPGGYHWRELMDVYPDAKVLLSVRDADSWVESMHNTIAQIFFGDTLMHHLAMAQYHVDPLYASWIDVLRDMWVEADIMIGSDGDRTEMAADMKRWNQEIIDTVPSERLLVWYPTDGWGPLCEFLEVPVPDAPLPAVNDTENFQKNLIMGPAINAINGWWEENRPQERQPGHLDSEDAAAKRGPAAASA
jgi:Sulfotransferase domain